MGTIVREGGMGDMGAGKGKCVGKKCKMAKGGSHMMPGMGKMMNSAMKGKGK